MNAQTYYENDESSYVEYNVYGCSFYETSTGYLEYDLNEGNHINICLSASDPQKTVNYSIIIQSVFGDNNTITVGENNIFSGSSAETWIRLVNNNDSADIVVYSEYDDKDWSIALYDPRTGDYINGTESGSEYKFNELPEGVYYLNIRSNDETAVGEVYFEYGSSEFENLINSTSNWSCEFVGSSDNNSFSCEEADSFFIEFDVYDSTARIGYSGLTLSKGQEYCLSFDATTESNGIGTIEVRAYDDSRSDYLTNEYFEVTNSEYDDNTCTAYFIPTIDSVNGLITIEINNGWAGAEGMDGINSIQLSNITLVPVN